MSDLFERLQVLLLLKAQPEPEAVVEPSEAMWVAFIEGRLQGRERTQVLAYIRANPEAYREWQDTLDALTLLPSTKAAVSPSLFQRFKAWWDVVPVPSLALAGLSASFLLALLVVPQLLAPDSALTQMHQQLSQLKSAKLESLLAQAPTANTQKFGFIPSAEGKARLDFAAGVDMARRSLITQNFAIDENQSAYQQLGQWTFFIWTLSQSALLLDADFWQAQEQFFSELRSQVDAEANIPALELGKIEMQLQRFSTTDHLSVYQQLEWLSLDLLEVLG